MYEDDVYHCYQQKVQSYWDLLEFHLVFLLLFAQLVQFILQLILILIPFLFPSFLSYFFCVSSLSSPSSPFYLSSLFCVLFFFFLDLFSLKLIKNISMCCTPFRSSNYSFYLSRVIICYID